MAGGISAREALGQALRSVLESSGLSRKDVEQRTGWSQPQVSRLFNLGLGRQRAPRSDAASEATTRRSHIPRVTDVVHVARVLTDDPDVRDRLVRLAENAQDERPRVVGAQVVLHDLGETQTRWGRLEASSIHLRSWGPVLVPGLLQTADYARSVFRSIEGKPDGEIERAVEARLERQSRSADRACTLLMTEGALWWGVPGPAVMAAQCDAITKIITSRPAWTVALIPRGTPGGEPPIGLYPVNGFDVLDDRLVMIGTTAGNIEAVHRPRVEGHIEMFDHLLALAVTGQDAVRLVGELAAEYRRMST